MKKHIPALFTIIGVFTLVLIANFEPAKFLIGWDNLLPELGFEFNIKRSIFSVWEEYQGLGLLAGNGHAASLIHQIFLNILSLAIPINMLRQVFIYAMLLAGSIGTYFLAFHILKENSSVSNVYEKRNILASIPASLFYMLNLATLQTFYVPFEPFIVHFGMLPWLLLSALYYLKVRTKRALLLFTIANIFAVPQGQVPTVFIVYLLSLLVISLYKGLNLHSLIAGIKVLLVTFTINAFWILPFLFFTLTNSGVAVDAKINQMATPNVIAQNREFGSLIDTLLLKGFWFNNVDPDMTGNTRFMLESWREHVKNPFAVLSGLLLFLLVLLGIVRSFLKKSKIGFVFFILLLITVTLVTTSVFPFSLIDSTLRKITLFNQVFRFPFTKFSILAGLIYAVFIAFGIRYLIAKSMTLSKKFLYVIPVVCLGLIITLSSPVFSGNLIYEKEKLSLPPEYTQTFEYFKTVDQNARIANFPQHTFWGWNFYNWGYGGSGFLWYGIKQPILDRAFDVWSKPLENYYYEISYALYAKDPVLFEQVLNKYHVSFLLIDKNVISPQSPKALFFSETEKLITEIPSIKQVKSFGNISIYEVTLKDRPQNFLYTTPVLPSSSGYSWGDNDIAYKKYGNYKVANEDGTYYPLNALFTKKPWQKDFDLKIEKENIIISKKLPKIDSASFVMPDVLSGKIVPVEIESKVDAGGNAVISARILTPLVTIGDVTVSDQSPVYFPLFVVPLASGNYTVSVNGVQETDFDITKNVKFRSYVFLQNDTFITLQAEGVEEILSQKIDAAFITSHQVLKERKIEVRNIAEGTEMRVVIPKGIDNFYSVSFNGEDFALDTACNLFRNGTAEGKVVGTEILLTAENDSVCASVHADTLPHDIGYLANLQTKNLEGNPLHFWVLNTNNGHAIIDTNLTPQDSFFIIPPMERHGLSYSFHTDSVSIGKNRSLNSIGSLEVIPFPYTYLSNMAFERKFISVGNPVTFTSTHPNESVYTMTVNQDIESPTTIVLSQSFDSGWKAYFVDSHNFLTELFPFLFGKEIKDHFKVNNWANGWEVNNQLPNQSSHVVITYLPQYLEYLGFVLILVFILVIVIAKPFRRIDRYFEPKARLLQDKVEKLLKR